MGNVDECAAAEHDRCVCPVSRGHRQIDPACPIGWFHVLPAVP
jgi:hypothetical protein